MTPDTLTPGYQVSGGLRFRVTPTGSAALPPVALVVADGPFYFQGYLEPQEARNLAALLNTVVDGLACQECQGNGEIRVNRSYNADPQEDDDVECPACNGTGAPT